MTTLAEQIGNLEADHASALAQIASLTSSNASLQASNVALIAENAGLVQKNHELSSFTDDTRAMVERLATDALDMLRASRRELFAPPASDIPFAPRPKLATQDKPLGQPVKPFDDTGAALDAVHEQNIALVADQLDKINAAPAEPLPPAEPIERVRPTVRQVMEGRDIGSPLPIFLQRDTAWPRPVGKRPELAMGYGKSADLLPAQSILNADQAAQQAGMHA